MLQFVASLQKWKVGSRQNDHGSHVIELLIDDRKKMILTELSKAAKEGLAWAACCFD